MFQHLMITKLALNDKISAHCKKLVAGAYLWDFANLVHALQHLSGKLAPHNNYSTYRILGAPLQMQSEH
jgi:hypothetical protein